MELTMDNHELTELHEQLEHLNFVQLKRTRHRIEELISANLYRIDRQILISMKILSKIPRAETAQCLYLFLASLPNDPIPVTMSRIRERLSLNMSNKEANRSIKNAIKTLEKIGYLKGKETEWNGEWAYQITDRNRALTSKV